MTISQFKAPPFEHQAQVVIKTTEDYECLNNNDNIIDCVGSGIEVTLPPQPVIGQRVKINAVTAAVNVNGNGRTVLGGNQVPAFGSSEYTYAGTDDWLASCCTDSD